MAITNTTRDLGRTVLLCLVGGAADAIAYLRFGTFVGAMTGNTVLLGIDLAEGHGERAFYHVTIVAVFLITVIGARLALERKMPVIVPLSLTALMLGLSGLIASQWGAVVSAAALGLQNAAVRNIGGVPINTAFITGDLVNLGSAVPKAPQAHHEIGVLATAWIAYAAGAVLGAVALRALSFPMIVPAVLALAAAIVEAIVERRNAARRSDS